MGDSILTPGPNRLITLDAENATTPTNVYVGVDDQLQVTICNAAFNVTVLVTVRLLLPDGTIVPNWFPFKPSNTRTLQTFVLNLAEGYILSVGVSTVSQFPASTFVQIAMFRNNTSTALQVGQALGQILCQGYVSNLKALSFPNGTIEGGQSLQGTVRSITGTVPGAGAEISESLPTGAIWLLRAFWYTLTASATVANRQIILTCDDGANVFVQLLSPLAVTAGSFQRVSWAEGALSNNGLGYATFPLPAGLLLAGNSRIRTNTLNLQAGDQYSAPQYLVEEWLLP